jgi:uncharacterized protein YbjT (DUF2867 family)
MQKVLITGATGVLGWAIVKSAVGAGLAVRQGVRNPSKADPVAEVIHLDYAESSTISPALEGISALVLMAFANSMRSILRQVTARPASSRSRILPRPSQRQ